MAKMARNSEGVKALTDLIRKKEEQDNEVTRLLARASNRLVTIGIPIVVFISGIVGIYVTLRLNIGDLHKDVTQVQESVADLKRERMNTEVKLEEYHKENERKIEKQGEETKNQFERLNDRLDRLLSGGNAPKR